MTSGRPPQTGFSVVELHDLAVSYAERAAMATAAEVRDALNKLARRYVARAAQHADEARKGRREGREAAPPSKSI